MHRKWAGDHELSQSLYTNGVAEAPKLSSMFESLDVNQDGTVSLEEFMQMPSGRNYGIYYGLKLSNSHFWNSTFRCF